MAASRLALIVVVAACGRFGFEPHGRGDDMPVDDAPGPSRDGPATGDATADAPVSMVCGSACTDLGGSCQSNTCVLVAESGIPVICPAGAPCRVMCESGACANGVTCPANTACEFRCTSGSCAYAFTCNGTACDIQCDGSGSCGDLAIACNAGTCTLHCCGTGTCYSPMASGPGAYSAAGTCP